MDSTNVIDDLDFEKLIDVVRSHPAIWNILHSDYSDKIKKENITDKRRKWGNVHDSHRKYKHKIKQSSGGADAKKIRKYVYVDFLAFLDSTFEQRETDSNYCQEDNDNFISSVHSIIDIENPDIKIN
ncbi:hypothetical protein QTP88_022848 [Uroleucon formosanum]